MNRHCHRTRFANAGTIMLIGTVAGIWLLPAFIVHVFVPALNALGHIFPL